MNFSLTEEQLMIRQTVRDFADRELAPLAAELDREGRFPREILHKMAALDLFALPFSEEYGGTGDGFLAYAIAVEEISRACASTGITYAAHCSLGAGPIYLFGSAEQKQQWVVPCARGEILAAFGLTEPEAGSDAGGTRTTAVLEGDEWVINGTKCFITNATYRRGGDHRRNRPGQHPGISAFIVPTDPRSGLPYEKLGLKASIRRIILRSACAPENLLGPAVKGQAVLRVLDGGRIGISALSGIARMLEASLARQERSGRPAHIKFQAIQFKRDIAGGELARLAVYRAA